MTSGTVEQAVKALYQAMLAHDVATLDNLLVEDAVYVHSPGFMESKAAFLQGVRDGLYVYELVRPTAERIMQSGNLAVVYDVLEFQGGPRGQAHPLVRLITTLVWARRDAAWRLVLQQATRAT
jgi:ketosteroid isomerase-like protein